MTKVRCMLKDCEYWKKTGDGTEGLCGCEEIEMDGDCTCFTCVLHTEVSPEYRETFWKRMKSLDDGHECRVDVLGKRYEMIGLTWFTEQDDRWGTDEIWFTEQRSGLKCKGKDIAGHAELIHEKVRAVSPVESLPEESIADL